MLIPEMKDTRWIEEKETQELLEYMRYLSDISAYLSLLFRYPSNDVYRSIQEYYEEFKNIAGEEYGVEFPVLPEQEEMEVEYVRLFQASLYGVVAPLYSSVYTSEERLVLRDSTLALRDLMHSVGFSLRDDIKEIEDNLYVMLEFVSVMLGKMSEGDADAIPYAFKVIKSYIAPMKDQFCKRLEDGAKLALYSSIALFLSRFVDELVEFCDFFCEDNIG